MLGDREEGIWGPRRKSLREGPFRIARLRHDPPQARSNRAQARCVHDNLPMAGLRMRCWAWLFEKIRREPLCGARACQHSSIEVNFLRPVPVRYTLPTDGAPRGLRQVPERSRMLAQPEPRRRSISFFESHYPKLQKRSGSFSVRSERPLSALRIMNHAALATPITGKPKVGNSAARRNSA
jgi:hypothetical protein